MLQDDYAPSRFLDMFNFFTAPDPTQGYGKLRRLLLEHDKVLMMDSQLRGPSYGPGCRTGAAKRCYCLSWSGLTDHESRQWKDECATRI